MARVLRMGGIVGGLEEAAGGDFILQFFKCVLPGEGERVGVPGPCLQDAGDSLDVIGVADEVGAAPGRNPFPF